MDIIYDLSMHKSVLRVMYIAKNNKIVLFTVC